jgi:hypothetical protein
MSRGSVGILLILLAVAVGTVVAVGVVVAAFTAAVVAVCVLGF